MNRGTQGVTLSKCIALMTQDSLSCIFCHLQLTVFPNNTLRRKNTFQEEGIIHAKAQRPRHQGPFCVHSSMKPESRCKKRFGETGKVKSQHFLIQCCSARTAIIKCKFDLRIPLPCLKYFNDIPKVWDVIRMKFKHINLAPKALDDLPAPSLFSFTSHISPMGTLHSR